MAKLIFILIAIPIVLATSHKEMEYINHIQTFSTCLLHIVNYLGVDFGNPKEPLVLSRYRVYEYMRKTGSGYKKEYHLKLHESSMNNTAIVAILQSVLRWRHTVFPCDAHFYLYPPTSESSPFNRGKPQKQLEIPPNYYNSLYHINDLYDGQGLIWSRNIYHILITEKNSSTLMWRRKMGQVVHFYPVVQLLILETKQTDTSSNVKIWVNNKCQRIFVPWNNENNFDLINLQTKLSVHESDCEQFVIIEGSLATSNRVYFWNQAFTRHDNNGVVPFRTFPNLEMFSQLSSDQIIFRLLFQNITFISEQDFRKKCVDDQNGSSSFCRNEIFQMPFSVTFGSFMKLNFIRNSEQFKFLSCGKAASSNLSFFGFISAFDTQTWLLIIVTYIGTLVVCFSIQNKKIECNSTTIWRKALFGGLKVFLEQSDGFVVRNNEKSETYYSSFYFAYGTLLLTSLVITHAYKGENISTLSSPLRSLPPETFNQLIRSEYKIYSKIHPLYIFELSLSIMFTKDEYKSESLILHTEINDFLLADFVTRNSKLIQTVRKNAHFHPNETLSIILNHNNFSYVNSIATCDNVALLGWQKLLKPLELQVLKFHQRKRNPLNSGESYLSMGKEKLYEQLYGWEIHDWKDKNIFMKLHALHESGISNEWLQIEKLEETRNLEIAASNNFELKTHQSLRLSGNTVTIFVVFLVGTVLSGIALIGEVIENRLIYTITKAERLLRYIFHGSQ